VDISIKVYCCGYFYQSVSLLIFLSKCIAVNFLNHVLTITFRPGSQCSREPVDPGHSDRGPCSLWPRSTVTGIRGTVDLTDMSADYHDHTTAKFKTGDVVVGTVVEYNIIAKRAVVSLRPRK